MEPPSTLEELRGAISEYESHRPRALRFALGPSELGVMCAQQIARKLAAAPQRRPATLAWAPFQGSAVHVALADVCRHWNARLGYERWIVEDALAIDELISGTSDAYDTVNACVVDWKHTGATAIKQLLTARRAGKHPREQISAAYRIQAHLYGLGHSRKNRDVKWVRLVLLSRSHDFEASAEWTEAYSPGLARWALDRYYAIKAAVDALDIEANPDAIASIPASPGSQTCKWCAFHRPGHPSDWDGCVGDVAATERARASFTKGLIAPKETHVN